MPAPLTMRKLLAADSGVPRRSLAAAWHFFYPNIAIDSETFSSGFWTKNSCYIAANCALDPFTGAYTVDKLVENGSANDVHYLAQVMGASTDTHTTGIVVEPAGRTWIRLVAAGGTKHAYFNLSGAGTVGTVSSGYTADIEALAGGWYLCTLTGAGAVSNSILIVLAEGDADQTYSGLGHSQVCAAGGGVTTAKLSTCVLADDTLNGSEAFFSDAPTTVHTVTDWDTTSKVMTFTPARSGAPDGTTCVVGPGIYIARAQLYPAATLPEYVATTDLQSLAGAYGTSVALQQGSTANADSSDFKPLGPGAKFETDDIGISPNLTGVTMAGAFSLFIAGKFSGTSGTIVSLAGSAGTTDFQRVAYNGSGVVRIGSKAGAAAETNSADLTVSTTAYLVLELKSDGTTLTLTNLTTGVAVTLASQAPTGAVRLGVYCNALSTIATIADAATGLSGLVYGRSVSIAERFRVLRALRAYWIASPRNVTVD